MGKQMFTILITSFCRTKSCRVKESLYLTAGRQISQQSTNFRQEVRTIHYVQLGMWRMNLIEKILKILKIFSTLASEYLGFSQHKNRGSEHLIHSNSFVLFVSEFIYIMTMRTADTNINIHTSLHSQSKEFKFDI